MCSVLNVKALVGTFNQEKALVGAFSVITNLRMDLRLEFYYTLLTPAACSTSLQHPATAPCSLSVFTAFL